VSIIGDSKPEVIVSFNDGQLYAFGPDSSSLWAVDIAHGLAVAYCSEPTVADLNQDGVPEIIVAVYGDPDVAASGYLMVLSNTGEVLADLALQNPGKRPKITNF
jgi:hypothetical protein